MEGRAGYYYGRFCERVEQHIERQERLKREFHEAVKATRRAMGQDAYGRGDTRNQVDKADSRVKPDVITPWNGTASERNDLVRKLWTERQSRGLSPADVAGMCGYNTVGALCHRLNRLGLRRIRPRGELIDIAKRIYAVIQENNCLHAPMIGRALPDLCMETIRYWLTKYKKQHGIG